MPVLGPDGKPVNKGSKKYMFAMEGQIFEPDSIILFEKELDINMKGKLVMETTLQVAFLAALKSIIPYWNSKPGIHPNIKNMTVFDKVDKERMEALKNTLEFFKQLDPPITYHEKVDDLKAKALNKMFDAVYDMPDAWNDDGTMKEDFAKERFKDFSDAYTV